MTQGQLVTGSSCQWDLPVGPCCRKRFGVIIIGIISSWSFCPTSPGLTRLEPAHGSRYPGHWALPGHDVVGCGAGSTPNSGLHCGRSHICAGWSGQASMPGRNGTPPVGFSFSPIPDRHLIGKRPPRPRPLTNTHTHIKSPLLRCSSAGSRHLRMPLRIPRSVLASESGRAALCLASCPHSLSVCLPVFE